MSSENETVIAFYGIRSTPERLAVYYQSATHWFEKLGHPPSNALVTGPNWTGRYTRFKTADSKLAKSGFTDVAAIEINASMSDPQYKWRDHFVSTFIDSKITFLHFSAIASIVPLSRTFLLPLAREVIQIMKPAYGIGYNMLREQGPTWYAMGVGYSKDIDTAVAKRSGKAGEEALNVSRWGNLYMPARVWEWGFLRDVYPWNFLSKPQLDKPVGDIPLDGWIGQDVSRGMVTPLSEGMVLWEVNEINIPHVRAALLEAGLIFEWNRHRTLVGG